MKSIKTLALVASRGSAGEARISGGGYIETEGGEKPSAKKMMKAK